MTPEDGRQYSQVGTVSDLRRLPTGRILSMSVQTVGIQFSNFGTVSEFTNMFTFQFGFGQRDSDRV